MIRSSSDLGSSTNVGKAILLRSIPGRTAECHVRLAGSSGGAVEDAKRSHCCTMDMRTLPSSLSNVLVSFGCPSGCSWVETSDLERDLFRARESMLLPRRPIVAHFYSAREENLVDVEGVADGEQNDESTTASLRPSQVDDEAQDDEKATS